MTPAALPRSARPNCAFFYDPDGFRVDRGENINGRRSAGASFLKGFIEHGGTDKLVALTSSRQHFNDFRALANVIDREGKACVRAHPLDRRTLRSVGTLFLPGPGLEKTAWIRRLGDERDYSLCGVTYTLSQSRIVNALGRYLIAPTQPWDALVCISKAARNAVDRLLDHHAHYLARRGGGRFHCPVCLPVIPLGVDCDAYAPRNDDAVPGAGPRARRELRARLNITNDDCAALFVGRLSFHAKAHPTPMYMAAARAAARVRGRTIHLLLVGQFANRSIESEFRTAAARFCGDARVHFLDGTDDTLVRAAWRAADIFVSLSDNIQESFGLAPIEAQAAGLPCVVSDWDGYKDTVTDGETGFRVPVTTAGTGVGIDIADRYAADLDSYDRLVGITSLAAAVDIDATAEAIARLANDRELRVRQAAAAMARARRLYDWRVVIATYQDLWTELRERRAAGAGVALRNRAAESAHVDFPDPFAIYQDYPTVLLDPETVVAAKTGDPAEDLARLRLGELHTFADYALLPAADIDALMERLAAAPARIGDLVADYQGTQRKLTRTLLWLRKFDLVSM